MFDKVRSIVYVRPHSIEIYNVTTIDVQKVQFPKDIFDGSEIKDPEKFKELLITGIAKLGFTSQRAIVVLADGVFFQKRFEKEADREQQIDHFYQKVTVPTGKLARKVIETKTAVYALATNREVYEVITYIFEEQGWHIDGVVPLTLYTDGKEESVLSTEEIKHIIADKKRLQKGNFLDKKTNNVKIPVIRIVTVLFLLVAFGSIAYFITRNRSVKKEVVTPVVVAPTPTAKPEITNKQDVTIIVKNGTGIAGQAGKAKDSLTALGFTHITTENADTKTAEDTVVTYNKNMGSSIKEEIKKALEKIFMSVVEKQTEGDSPTIEIITGKYTSQ